jgi:hypothetical protein
MTPHIIRISVDDDFGTSNNNNYWLPKSVYRPAGVVSISGSEAIVDENILRGRNSWTVVSSLMSRNFSLRDSTQKSFKNI